PVLQLGNRNAGRSPALTGRARPNVIWPLGPTDMEPSMPPAFVQAATKPAGKGPGPFCWASARPAGEHNSPIRTTSHCLHMRDAPCGCIFVLIANCGPIIVVRTLRVRQPRHTECAYYIGCACRFVIYGSP